MASSTDDAPGTAGPPRVEIVGVPGLPEIDRGHDLAGAIVAAMQGAGLTLAPGDTLVVTQKIVSKAEGCEVDLATIEPTPLARAWAGAWQKDPRVVELVLRESVRVLRMDRGVLITETRHGFVCANAGVDQSNSRPGYALTLPADPDRSARSLRARLAEALGVGPGVVVSDTFGRPWREGQVNVAIGCAGVRAFDDYRGVTDEFGRTLQASLLAVADEVASAAELVMGKTRGVPVALVRGVDLAGDARGRDLLRPPAHDLFR